MEAQSSQPGAVRSDPQPTPDYAPAPRLRWIGRHRKLLIFAAFCIAAAMPIYWYWAPLKYRVLWLYWSRQAAAHVMPVQAMDVTIRDPARVNLVPTTNPDYVVYTATPPAMFTGNPPAPSAMYAPLPYRHLQLLDARLNITGGPGIAVLFMGTLRRPDGTPRLVIVTGGSGVSSNLLAMTKTLVLPLPQWNDPLPPGRAAHLGMAMGFSGPPPIPTQLKTGVIDPTDPTHIVFEFIARPPVTGPAALRGPGTRPADNAVTGGGIIDAHLQNDDSLAFKLRSYWGNVRNANIGRSSVIAGDVKALEAQAQARQAGAPTGGSRSTTTPTRSSRGGRGGP
jgi:hypothetical protein